VVTLLRGVRVTVPWPYYLAALGLLVLLGVLKALQLMWGGSPSVPWVLLAAMAVVTQRSELADDE
jgi:alkanesulfonate monooxygenase SsuD/methylene tetrahydromethanopterin reductase-like flavin-dependent oxidoreductase (luciferase family)